MGLGIVNELSGNSPIMKRDAERHPGESRAGIPLSYFITPQIDSGSEKNYFRGISGRNQQICDSCQVFRYPLNSGVFNLLPAQFQIELQRC
jgi:hypothetical protein